MSDTVANRHYGSFGLYTSSLSNFVCICCERWSFEKEQSDNSPARLARQKYLLGVVYVVFRHIATTQYRVILSCTRPLVCTNFSSQKRKIRLAGQCGVGLDSCLPATKKNPSALPLRARRVHLQSTVHASIVPSVSLFSSRLKLSFSFNIFAIILSVAAQFPPFLAFFLPCPFYL